MKKEEAKEPAKTVIALTTRSQRKQIRLDKAVKRYANNLRKNQNRARYY